MAKSKSAAGSLPEVIIHVVSDSAGDTGELVVRAAIAQFHPLRCQIKRSAFVQNAEVLRRAVAQAKEDEAIILYTLVIPELREALLQLCREEQVTAIDLLGPLIDSLEGKIGRPSRHEPGLNHVLDADYFRKIEAVEFAVRYDDAKDTSGVLQADIVLIGVSRTSKTPLSMYLAHRKFKVANVPLMPELKPPEELFSIDAKKIIGLTIGTHYLNIIRKERLKALGLPKGASYASTARIEQELAYAKAIMDRLGCLVIDVSHRAVEETASLIVEHIRGQTGS